MPRGQKAEIGDRTVNRNGYEYERTKDGWVGSNVLVMEKHLGRKLAPNEFVAYKNGHKPPITLDMLELRTKGDKKSKHARLATIEDRIEQLQEERRILMEEIGEQA